MKVISPNIKALREQRGISQKDLSEIIGIGQSQLSKYESGSRPLSLDISNKLADYFGVTIDCVIGRKEVGRADVPPRVNKLSDIRESLVELVLRIVREDKPDAGDIHTLVSTIVAIDERV